ncbi:SDR family oxidoreductase [Roseateles sp.]|uniref:SDR family oxidoreductase n=1 Tax=Roseateles sp. TaxID=1971397 RepID=UPI003BA3F630
MRIAITGARGLLGSAFGDALTAQGHEVSVIARTALGGDAHASARLLAGADWLLHAAANTNVELCEADFDACYRDNLALTELLADATRLAAVPMVYFSSTGVYGSAESLPYAEYHDTNPTTHHHRAKRLGEIAVLGRAPCNLVIRTGWLFGGAVANPKNFVARRIEDARRAQACATTLRSNQQQVGSPTFTRDVVERVLALIASGNAGIFNCVNEGSASRFDYVREIVRLSGLPVEVEPATAASFNRRARVSDNEAASNWRMTQLGFEPMPRWQDSLADYIDSLAGELT